jgi:hypothetical protein
MKSSTILLENSDFGEKNNKSILKADQLIEIRKYDGKLKSKTSQMLFRHKYATRVI